MSKVMLINSLGYGGAERVFSNLTNYFNENNVDFNVVSLLNVNDYYNCSDNKPTYLTECKALSFITLLKCLIVFFIYCVKNKVTLVQSHLFWSNYINVITSKILSYDCQLVHCVAFNSKFKKGKKRSFHFFACNFLLKYASLNVFKSYEMRDEYIELFKLDKNKTKVIYNPIDLEVSAVKSYIHNKNPKINSKPFSIGLVGRFHLSKRYFDVLKLANIVSNDFVFYCIGTGDELSEINEKLINFNLTDKVHLLGWQSEPLKLLANMDAYLCCSEAEGFPNSLIEAMSVGLPCIHSNCMTGPKEILGHVESYEGGLSYRKFGLTFEIGDIEAIKNGLNNLVKNPVLYSKYSEASLNRVKELKETDCFKEYLTVFDEASK
ncbi:glycosyltransferase [Pseudoalteromonas sp. ZZD1]|uniref:glycosyltransferase n=1 Tax=Pseudoalteromonas sp. ZZD1 TaxID=3139395 RepID=UPI003BAB87F0